LYCGTGRYVPSAEARSWYDSGTSAIRQVADFQASKALGRAIEIDESFALARARLAEAYSEMEYAEKAKQKLLQAIALIPDRSRISNTDTFWVNGNGSGFVTAPKACRKTGACSICSTTPNQESAQLFFSGHFSDLAILWTLLRSL